MRQDDKDLSVLLVRTLYNTPGVLPGFCHLVANLHFFSATNYGKWKVDLWRKGTLRLGISFDALAGIVSKESCFTVAAVLDLSY